VRLDHLLSKELWRAFHLREEPLPGESSTSGCTTLLGRSDHKSHVNDCFGRYGYSKTATAVTLLCDCMVWSNLYETIGATEREGESSPSSVP
jgi:hypothetical protein